MAKVPLVLACSHSPFLYTPPEHWNQIRAKRPLREDVPHDSVETIPGGARNARISR